MTQLLEQSVFCRRLRVCAAVAGSSRRLLPSNLRKRAAGFEIWFHLRFDGLFAGSEAQGHQFVSHCRAHTCLQVRLKAPENEIRSPGDLVGVADRLTIRRGLLVSTETPAVSSVRGVSTSIPALRAPSSNAFKRALSSTSLRFGIAARRRRPLPATRCSRRLRDVLRTVY